MQKLIVMGVALALNACGRNSGGPSVPEPISSSAADASPDSGENYDTSIPAAEGTASNEPKSSDGTVTGGDASVPRVDDGSQVPVIDGSGQASRTIKLSDDENLGVWEGWGTSLGWWANGVGKSNYETLYADLLFTNKDVKFLDDKVVPGLALGIVRYNVGGGGRKGDISTLAELEDKKSSSDNAHDGFEPYRDIDGFWKDNTSDDSTSDSFDWNRDANQRSMMQLARRRGVNTFELYSNAPMWWMTEEKSAAGGHLTADQRSNYMLYLALTAKMARTAWGIPVSSVEAFNEPTSGKWTLPLLQQGCGLTLEEQVESLAYLKLHLAQQGASDLKIASADERNPTEALANHEFMKVRSETIQGITVRASDLYDKVNVHTADNGKPFRDNTERAKLKASVGSKRLWVSDYNDTDNSGMDLAQTIFQDMKHLKPSAWIYFQAVEPYGKKGLVTGNFHTMPGENAVRGKPSGVATKYYVMAQFSRFIRSGQTLLGSGDETTVTAFDAANRKLTLVTLNSTSKEQTVAIDLTQVKSWNELVTIVITRADGSKLFKSKQAKINGNKVNLVLEPGSVTSLEMSDVVFP